MKRKLLHVLLVIFIVSGSYFVLARLYELSIDSSNSRMLGKRLWSLSFDQPILSTPVSIQGNIIVRTNRDIYALSKTDGHIIWKTSSTLDSSILASPITGDPDNVVTLENSNSASVYSLATGVLILNLPAQADFISDLKLSSNVLLLSRHNTFLTAYEITSGIKLWEVEVPNRSHLSLAANSTYAVLSADNQIRIYDLQTGKLLKDKTYGALTGELILEGDTIFLCYVKNRNWYIVSSQLDTLHKNWVYDAGEIAPPYLSVENDQLYVYNQTLIALNKYTGEMLWIDETQDNYSAPAVLEKDLYYVSLKGFFHKNLCNLETASGMIKECDTLRLGNSFQGDTSEVTGPIIVDNMLILTQGSSVSAYQIEP